MGQWLQDVQSLYDSLIDVIAYSKLFAFCVFVGFIIILMFLAVVNHNVKKQIKLLENLAEQQSNDYEYITSLLESQLRKMR